MTRARILVLSVALAVCVAAAGGCNPGTYEKETFLLEASRQAGPVTGQIDATLAVQRFSVDAAFAAKNFVYRLDEFKYEPDYYREFLITPSAMVTEKTRQWLVDSGVFAQVLPRGSRMQPAYTLEGSVTALYGDFRDEAAPVAVLEVRYFLLRHEKAGQTVVFAQTYRAVNPIPVKTAEALIDALSRDLTDILTRLESDLRQSLPAKPG